MSAVARLSIETLAQRCREETDKFNRREPSDPQFCFELLRRALAEGSSEAFTYVYRVYEHLVLNWVYSHPRFGYTDESAEFFASQALRSFYFALRGPKFSRFPGLPQVLAYLKLCVHTAITQYLRDQRHTDTVPLDATRELAYTPNLDAKPVIAELWDVVCQALPDERDRLLAHYAFVQHLKPREIIAARPNTWRDEREVSVALYRIRRTLRNNVELRARLEIAPEQSRSTAT